MKSNALPFIVASVVCLCAFVTSHATATSKLTFDIDGCPCEAEYDEKYSKETLLNAVELAKDQSFPAMPLGMCETINEKDFEARKQIYIQQSEELEKHLRSLIVPPQLEKYKADRTRSVQFMRWLELSLLDYVRTKNAFYLRQPFDGQRPPRVCDAYVSVLAQPGSFGGDIDKWKKAAEHECQASGLAPKMLEACLYNVEVWRKRMDGGDFGCMVSQGSWRNCMLTRFPHGNPHPQHPGAENLIHGLFKTLKCECLDDRD